MPGPTEQAFRFQTEFKDTASDRFKSATLKMSDVWKTFVSKAKTLGPTFSKMYQTHILKPMQEKVRTKGAVAGYLTDIIKYKEELSGLGYSLEDTGKKIEETFGVTITSTFFDAFKDVETSQIPTMLKAFRSQFSDSGDEMGESLKFSLIEAAVNAGGGMGETLYAELAEELSKELHLNVSPEQLQIMRGQDEGRKFDSMLGAAQRTGSGGDSKEAKAGGDSKEAKSSKNLFASIGKSIGGLGKTVLKGFAPLLGAMSIVKLLADALGGIIEMIQDQLEPLFVPLQMMLTEVVTAFMPLIDQLFPIIADVFKTLSDTLMPIIDNIIPLITEAFQTLANMIIPLIPPIMELMGILWELGMQIVMALLPVLQLVIDIVLKLVEALMPVVKVLIDILIAVLMPVIDALVPVIAMLADVLMMVLTPIIDALMPVLVILADVIGKLVKNNMKMLVFGLTFLAKIIKVAILPTLFLFTLQMKAFAWVLTNVVLPIIEGTVSVFDWMAKKIGSVMSIIVDIIWWFVETAVSAYNAIPLVSDIALDGVREAKPEFAEGGVVTGPTEAIIGEAGYPEAVLPLTSKPLSLNSETYKILDRYMPKKPEVVVNVPKRDNKDVVDKLEELLVETSRKNSMYPDLISLSRF